MVIQSWDLAPETWTSWLQACSPDAIVVAVRTDRVCCCRRQDLEDGIWSEGHVFDEDWHLQWRALGAVVRVAGGGDLSWANTTDPEAQLDLQEAVVEDQAIVLWGEKYPDDRYWIELRVPHLMESPHQHPRGATPEEHKVPLRRVLVQRTYRDARTHALLYVHYADLRTAPANDLPHVA